MNGQAGEPGALELTQALIARASVTPDDKGCQDLIAQLLTPCGFERLDLSAPTGDPPVRNLWLRLGRRAPLLVLAGHTDVVPAGQVRDWRTGPFTPTIADGWLYGRGASDMKASVAAMVCALRTLAPRHRPDQHGSVALLLTSDEEGEAVDGTQLALKKLIQDGVRIDHCLIGEPTSVRRCGDTIKIGRRGSLSARLTVHGKQGHIAYPQLAENPIHALMRELGEFIDTPLDTGTQQFEPSSLQFSSIRSGVAGNIIPGQVTADFNVRFCPEYSAQGLRAEIERRLQQTDLRYEIEWKPRPGEPFLSRKQNLADRLGEILAAQCGQNPRRSTSGGTSDGRFIAAHCDDLVEFGPCNDTIHQVNERVGIGEIAVLERVYTELVARTLKL